MRDTSSPLKCKEKSSEKSVGTGLHLVVTVPTDTKAEI